MSETPLKDMAQHRNLKAGHFVFEFDTPGIGHILKSAGCDFTIFDTEHSGFGIETTKRVLRYMQAAELPTIVRVPSKDYKDIARACDAGAEGVMLPMVSTPEEAEGIVQSMKYVPRGGRGVIVRCAFDRFTAGDTVEKLNFQNTRTTLFAQIETADGVKNADAIAAVDGCRLPLGRPFRPVLLAGHSRAVRPPRLSRRNRNGAGCVRQARQVRRPARAGCRQRDRAVQAGIRFHRLFRGRLGTG